MIRVLVVEDSQTVQEHLLAILGGDPDLRVVGVARDGEEALGAVAKLRPDVITMDIHMPKLDGFEATRRIMETHPTPIVVVSGSSTLGEASTAFRAVEAGALATVQRPTGVMDSGYEASARELVQTVKLMSEVKVVKRWTNHRPHPASANHAAGGEAEPLPALERVRLVAIGASTGGPPVLKEMLGSLPARFPAPILVVQHMASGFTPGFAEWLADGCALRVGLARQGEIPAAGRVYVAPDGAHLEVRRDGTLALSGEEAEEGHRPSVARLFRSVADTVGRDALGILLSGTGRDGAAELRLMKDRGAVTIAQDAASSVVNGMPGEAVRLGGASLVASPARIIAILNRLANGQGRGLDEDSTGPE